MKKLLFALTVVVLLASCNAAKKAAKTPVPGTADTSVANVEEEGPSTVIARLNNVDFKTFSGKVNVDYDDGKGNGKSVNVKLVMKKDEVIWMSAGLLGFEGVRAMITKDSVKVLDKLHKQYTATSLAYIQDKIGLPVNFNTLQDLLIGNAVFVDKDNASLTKQENNYVIATQEGNFKNLLTVVMPGYLPSESKLDDVDASKNRSAQLNYSDYKSANGRSFSTLRNINVKYKDNITIKLNFISYDFDGEVSTPFSVPSGYKTKQ
ncbi:MAG: DUF4292 domain-containing protein [Niabella sp.]